MADVFISYSRSDKAFVTRLAAALGDRGNEVWVDWDDIAPTAEWEAEIERGIDAADAVCFVISPSSLTSQVCARELEYAVGQRKRLIPLLHREPNGAPVPPALGKRNWVFFREDDSADAALDTLQQAIDTDLERVRQHTRLGVRAHEWEQRSQEKSVLLRGNDLRDAERFLAADDGGEPQPTPLQRQYVLASRRAASRRQRGLLGAAVIAVVISTALAVLALVERNEARRQARDATSRALAAEATARLDSDPAVSVALALEGTRVADTPQAARALRAAVVESRLRRVLAEPTGRVDAVAFSPRGDRIVSTEMTGARIWDASTGRRLTSFFDATYQPHLQVAFGDGGETIMVAPDPQAEECLGSCSDRTVRLWRADQVEPRNLTHADSATGAAFVTRNRIVTGAGDGIVRLWSADDHPHVMSELGEARGYPVTPYANQDGDTVVTVAGNGSAEIWRLEPRAKRVFTLPPVRIDQDGYKRVGAITDDGSYAAVAREKGVVALIRLGKRPHVVARLTGHTHPVSAIAFDDAGERVATAAGTGYFFSFDPQALVWSTRDASRIASLGGHTGPVTGVSFAPQTGVIFTTSGDGYGRVWALDGRLLSVLRGHTKDITSASFAPDGRTIATGSEDGTIRIWDAGIGTRPQAAGVRSPTGVSARSPDRTRLALDQGAKTVIWDLATGKLTDLKGSYPASSIAFDAAGRRVIVGSRGVARVFDVEGRPLTPFLRGNAKDGEVTSAALSPDGRWAVTAGTNELFDGGDRIILWRLSDRSAIQVRRLSEGEKTNEVSSFSADGRWLVAEEDIDQYVLDMSNGKKLEAPLEAMLSLPAVFSLDGKIVVMPMGPTVWRVGSWRKPVCQGDDFAAVSAIALSGDARTIATGGFRGELLLRNARTCKIEAALDQGGTGIDAVDFSPDKRFLLSAAGSLVRVTDLQTRDDVAVFVVPGVVSAGFGADPTQIWTTSGRVEGGDGDAQLFRCVPCGSLKDLRREAERLILIRPLQKGELDQYVKGD